MWEFVYNGVVYRIMWKEILLMLAIIIIIGSVIGFLSHNRDMKKYNSISEQFQKQEFDSIEQDIYRLWMKYDCFTMLPASKNVFIIYNNLCYSLASIALSKGDEQQFLHKINAVKKEHLCEQKSFMLALYYRSLNELDVAQMYYKKYIECQFHTEDMAIIMNALFASSELVLSEQVLKAAKNFCNPANQWLLKVNGILKI